MISAILYGRNDSYGYNLHKRAAISLNTLAEIFTHPDDEIIFVDYNTVDDLPTFPEAIRDTLTSKARRLLRTIRVRSWVHDKDKLGPRPQLSEPLARNIGIRRARPENRWILSTNTDMVFVPKEDRSLSDLVGGLADGYYGLPRYEVPETLWETVDRMDPAAILESFRAWGQRYCLNETVLSKPYIIFDGPGDFQLVPRQTLMDLDGFDERMVYGWHVDSNLAKRMWLHFGEVRSLADQFLGYHCDHTRVTTPAHSSNRLENSWHAYCEDMATPDISGQRETWGLPGVMLEELRIDETAELYVGALDALYPGEEPEPAPATYTEKSFNSHVFYNTRHAFPYIADTLVSTPRTLRLAYVGRNAELVSMLTSFWRHMDFRHPILAHDPASPEGGCDPQDPTVRWVSDAALLAEAELFLIDYHCSGGLAVQNAHGHPALRLEPDSLRFAIGVTHAMLRLAAQDQRAVLTGRQPRKFLLAGVQNTSFEHLAAEVIGLIAVPYSCHIRHGFIRTTSDIAGPLRVFDRLVAMDEATVTDICRRARLVSGLPEDQADLMRVYDAVLEPIRAEARELLAGNRAGPKTEESVLRLALALSALLGNFGDVAMLLASFLLDIPTPAAPTAQTTRNQRAQDTRHASHCSSQNQ